MLDTKRQRGWVIVAVVGAWLVLGMVWTVAAGRAADRNFEAFSERAAAAFAGTDAASMDELQADATVEAWTGEGSDLFTFLAQAGEVSDYESDAHVAHYRLPDAWGRSATATVTWTGGGFTISQD